MSENKAVIERQDIERLYHKKGLSLKDVGERLGCSDVTVLRKMREYGIDRRSISEASGNSYAPFHTHKNGYEVWNGRANGKPVPVRVHQVLAIAAGEDAHQVFSGGEYQIHHLNNIPWDNREENITLIEASEHSAISAAHRYGDHRPVEAGKGTGDDA